MLCHLKQLCTFGALLFLQSAQASSSPPIAYVTDVEGDWNKLATFAQDSPVMSIDSEGHLELADGAIFVFGGDAVDFGPGAKRILAELIRLKDRYPERVVLIGGNRDINKLRFLSEIAPVTTEESAQNEIEKMKTIFSHTMNARIAFEMRRTELQETFQRSISDRETFDDYLNDLRPGGLHYEFLLRCQLAYRHGKTLFVHGAVTVKNLGYVPNSEERFDSLDDWILNLNRWYRNRIARAQEKQFASELILYQHPRTGGVVYSRYTDNLGNPSLPPKSLLSALESQGIHRIVIGHSPQGHSPTILRSSTGFEIIFGDNYHVAHPNQVLILDDKVLIDSLIMPKEGAPLRIRSDTDTLHIGMRRPDGSLIKGKLLDGTYVSFQFGPEYAQLYSFATAAELNSETLRFPELCETALNR